MGNGTYLTLRPIAGLGAGGDGGDYGFGDCVNNEFVVVGVAGSDWRRSWVDESEERMCKSSLRIHLRLWMPRYYVVVRETYCVPWGGLGFV